MKVCTDSCLFGAWAAGWTEAQKPFTSILDIGAGTGLLSLMLAQKNRYAQIDTIEIETAAALQGRENFARSPWADKLSVTEGDIKTFTADKRYDFIISNPPFYQNDLLGEDESKNKAHHHTSLSFTGLTDSVKRLLSPTGYFAVLLPFHRSSAFENLAFNEGLFISQKTIVKPAATKAGFRVMLLLSREEKKGEPDEIIIKSSDGNYTSGFIALLKDYYLYL